MAGFSFKIYFQFARSWVERNYFAEAPAIVHTESPVFHCFESVPFRGKTRVLANDVVDFVGIHIYYS